MTEIVATAALAAATAHYDRLRGQTIEVPEWGSEGAPLVIYYDPITAAQSQSIVKRAKGNDARATALAVILYSKDKAGKPIFTDDAPTLKAFENDVLPEVIARIGQAILGITGRGADLGN
ncbi:hypothetical protein KX928_17440 [Roseobacter sp. YSTF-M11]|uniref:Phage tail protein n=1 Tax=Roseobacter insulae TaxID=2859783 RepID=A0A9X1K3H5_9RHOB|nr:hypothetical protein [Roseobacter insulae]MBW4709573.1 hypothetical protein [Roseobacter insulae]